jgi:hypothetical protein
MLLRAKYILFFPPYQHVLYIIVYAYDTLRSVNTIRRSGRTVSVRDLEDVTRPIV